MQEDDELVMIRVSKALIDKARQKLDCHPDTPAVYVVDQALREYTKNNPVADNRNTERMP